MPSSDREIAYFEARFSETIFQADNATGRSARIAHLGLARLYRAEIAHLKLGATRATEFLEQRMLRSPSQRRRR
jgi:hypothetical protein